MSACPPSATLTAGLSFIATDYRMANLCKIAILQKAFSNSQTASQVLASGLQWQGTDMRGLQMAEEQLWCIKASQTSCPPSTLLVSAEAWEGAENKAIMIGVLSILCSGYAITTNDATLLNSVLTFQGLDDRSLQICVNQLLCSACSLSTLLVQGLLYQGLEYRGNQIANLQLVCNAA